MLWESGPNPGARARDRTRETTNLPLSFGRTHLLCLNITTLMKQYWFLEKLKSITLTQFYISPECYSKNVNIVRKPTYFMKHITCGNNVNLLLKEMLFRNVFSSVSGNMSALTHYRETALLSGIWVYNLTLIYFFPYLAFELE